MSLFEISYNRNYRYTIKISYKFKVLTAVIATSRILMMEAAGSLEMSLHFQYHTTWHHLPQALSSYIIRVKILMAHSCG